MIITKDWLDTNKTANGGWTRAQLALLNVDCKANPNGENFWQPRKGWQNRVVGIEIDATVAQQFIDFATVLCNPEPNYGLPGCQRCCYESEPCPAHDNSVPTLDDTDHPGRL